MNKIALFLLLLPLGIAAQTTETEKQIAQHLSTYASNENSINLENNMLTVVIGDMNKPTGLTFEINLSKAIDVNYNQMGVVNRFYLTSSEDAAIHYQHGNSQKSQGGRAYFSLENAPEEVVNAILNYLK